MRLLLMVRESRSRRLLLHELTEGGHTVASTPSAKDGLARLEGEPFDLVVIDLPAPGRDEMKLIRALKERSPETEVVVVPGSPKVEEAVGSLGFGRVEFLRPPVDSEKVRSLLERVGEHRPPAPHPPGPSRTWPEGRGPTPHAPPHSSGVEPLELGEGRLQLAASEERVQKVLRIDATDAPPNLLVRLLIGSYITGQDRVFITARNGLMEAQRREIHRIVDRTLGMSVVGDSPEIVEVQNFIDPGKHELPRLVHRVAQMLRTEIDVCRSALLGKGTPPLALIDTLEEEVDRLYLLIVRQLLLSSDSPRIARSIDVQSHHYGMGYRVVARALELTGDLIHGVGVELQRNLPGLRRLPRPMLHELVSRIERLDHLLTRTMDALDRLSAIDANSVLNVIGEALPQDAAFCQRISRAVPSSRVAVSAQRIAFHLDMALEMLVILNEVTINRSVEPETVARTGTPVPTRSRLPAKPHRPSPPKPLQGVAPRGTVAR